MHQRDKEEAYIESAVSAVFFLNDQLQVSFSSDPQGLLSEYELGTRFDQFLLALEGESVNETIELFNLGNPFQRQIKISETAFLISARPIQRGIEKLPFWVVTIEPENISGASIEYSFQGFPQALIAKYSLPVYFTVDLNFQIISFFSGNNTSGSNDLLETSVLDLVCPDEREEFINLFFKAANGQLIDLDLELKSGLGIQHYNFRIIPLADKKKTIHQVAISINDITQSKQKDPKIEQRKEFGKLITSLAKDLINSSEQTFDHKINKALEQVGRFANVDRCYIFVYNTDGHYVRYAYEWCDSGISPQKDDYAQISADSLPWFWEKITSEELLYIPWVEKLEPAAKVEREVFTMQEIKSLIAVPMWHKGEFFGFAGFDTVRQVKHWQDEEIELLKVLGEIFMNGMVRQKMLHRLMVSKKDYQTLFNNAHDAIILLDPVTEEIIGLNSKALSLYGYQHEEMIGQSMESFTKDVEKGKFFIEEIKEKGVLTLETVHFHRNGLPMFLEINASIVDYLDGKAIMSINRDVTQKKLSQKALQENKERFRLISELTSDFAYALKKEEDRLKFEWFSKSFYLHFNIDIDFINNFVMIIHPDDRLRIEEYFYELSNSFESMEIEYRVIDKYGELKWFNNISRPIWDMEEGKVVRILGAARDITDKKNSTAQLKEKDEKYRTLFNIAGDFYFIHDLQGKIFEVNDIACESLGYLREELTEMKITDIMVSPWHETFQTKLPELDHENHVVFESMISSGKSQVYPVEIKSQLIAYEGNQAVLSIARDVTERKEAQQMLQRELNQNLILTQLSKELLATDFSIEQISQKVLHYSLLLTESEYGFVGEANENSAIQRAQCLDLDHFDYDVMHHSEEHDCFRQEFYYHWRKGLVLRKAYLFQYDEPNKYNSQSSGKVEHFTNFLSVPAIINQQTHGQIAIANSKGNYQEEDIKILQRVAHFYALALQKWKSEEELKMRNSELNNFVYKVNHDLRAPLSSMHGLINLIKISDNEADKTNYFSLIENRVIKLDSFIREILSHSKNLNMPVSISEIDFEKVIKTSYEDLKYLTGHKLLKIELDIEKKQFYSDTNRLFEIFRNLISNSIKYMHYEQNRNILQIRIKIKSQTAMVEVLDNGIGIENEYIDRIFDMFFKGTEKSDGSGIGLYIVSQTLKKLGGSIVVESDRSWGTKFTLNLPNAVKDQDQVDVN